MKLNIKLPDHTGTQLQPLLFVNMAEQPQVFKERSDTVAFCEFAEKHEDLWCFQPSLSMLLKMS